MLNQNIAIAIAENNISAILFVKSPYLKIVYSNHKAIELIGDNLEKLKQLNLPDIISPHEQDIVLPQFYRTLERRFDSATYETQILNKALDAPEADRAAERYL